MDNRKTRGNKGKAKKMIAITRSLKLTRRLMCPGTHLNLKVPTFTLLGEVSTMIQKWILIWWTAQGIESLSIHTAKANQGCNCKNGSNKYNDIRYHWTIHCRNHYIYSFETIYQYRQLPLWTVPLILGTETRWVYRMKCTKMKWPITYQYDIYIISLQYTRYRHLNLIFNQLGNMTNARKIIMTYL